MWIAELEDGTVALSNEIYWTNLKKDNRIVRLSFTKTLEGLKNMDSYYYVEEALFMVPDGPVINEAGVIGGIDIASQAITELRLDYKTGAVRTSTKSISELKYSKDILIPGKK